MQILEHILAAIGALTVFWAVLAAIGGMILNERHIVADELEQRSLFADYAQEDDDELAAVAAQLKALER